MVDKRVVLLADVAVPGGGRAGARVVLIQPLDAGGWQHVRRREHRLPTERADARARQHLVIPAGPLGLPLADGGLHHAPPRSHIGVVDCAGSVEKTPPVRGRNSRKQAAVGNDCLEQFRGGAKITGEITRSFRRGELFLRQHQHQA